MAALAESPARVCLGGESLDWINNGPSVVGAIGLSTQASVEGLRSIGSHHIIYVESKSPIPEKTLRSWRELHWYSNDYLKYVESAIDSVRERYDTQPKSLVVTIDSNVPVQAGVSSSAAVTLATVAATALFFNHHYSTSDTCEVAYKVEHDKLKTGAGKMDFYACGVGGLIYLNCAPELPEIKKYQFPSNLSIVLVDTRTPHETKSFISSKRKRFQEKDPGMMYYADHAPLMVERMHQLLPNFADNVEEIGAIVSHFHKLLRDEVQSSTPMLNLCVETAIANGAYGAKLTGSGLGGCMFAIVNKEREEEVTLALKELPGVRVYNTTIVDKGIVSYQSESEKTV